MELDREQLGEGKITRPEVLRATAGITVGHCWHHCGPLLASLCNNQIMQVRRLQAGPAAFWLMTFNVLAPRFSSPDVYTWCAAEALCWSARWPRILAQLLQQSPDLLALQATETRPATAADRGRPHAAADSGHTRCS